MAPKLAIARIVRAHGMKGEVKVLPFLIQNSEILSQIPLFFKRQNKETYTPLHVENIRPAPGEGFLVKFQEVSGREEAEALKGEKLYVDQESLPPKGEDEYYVYELIGLEVRLSEGGILGLVKALMPVGPYDLLEVQLEDGQTVYIPMIDEIIRKIDLKDRYIQVSLPEGLLESQRS